MTQIMKYNLCQNNKITDKRNEKTYIFVEKNYWRRNKKTCENIKYDTCIKFKFITK
jgi:hypothetical protein